MSRKGHDWETYIRRAERLGYTVKQGKNNRVIINTYYGKRAELQNHAEFIRWVIKEERIQKRIDEYLTQR